MDGLKINSCNGRGLFLALLPLWWALAGSPSLAMAQINSGDRASTCRTSQLLATEDRKESDGIDGGVGHHAVTIGIQNRSSSPCILHGIPNLQLSYTATRSPFSAQVCSNCRDYLFPRQSVTEIFLEPKRSAYVVLGFNVNGGNGGCTEADRSTAPDFKYSDMTVNLYLPDQHQSSLKINFGPWRSCGVIDITPFLKQPPVESSLPETAPQQN
jgi:hypothetical protein